MYMTAWYNPCMAKPIRDLTGKRIGKWVVIRRDVAKTDKSGSALWKCRCDCGTEKVLPSRHLLVYMRDTTKLHGCVQCGMRTGSGKATDITGAVFGTWRVLRRNGTHGEGKNKKSLWACVCIKCNTSAEIVRGLLVLATGKPATIEGTED